MCESVSVLCCVFLLFFCWFVRFLLRIACLLAYTGWKVKCAVFGLLSTHLYFESNALILLCVWNAVLLKVLYKSFFPIWFNLPSPISHRIIFKTLAVFIIPHIYILYTLKCVFLVLEFHIFLKHLQIKKKKQINQLFLLATFTLFFIVYVYERVEEKAA